MLRCVGTRTLRKIGLVLWAELKQNNAVLLDTPTQLSDLPKHLILLSSDPGAFVALKERLAEPDEAAFRLRYFDIFSKIKSFDLESNCHAVLVDVRHQEHSMIEAIRWIGEQRLKVVIIALCSDFQKLPDFDDVVDRHRGHPSWPHPIE